MIDHLTSRTRNQNPKPETNGGPETKTAIDIYSNQTHIPSKKTGRPFLEDETLKIPDDIVQGFFIKQRCTVCEKALVDVDSRVRHSGIICEGCFVAGEKLREGIAGYGFPV